MLKHKSTQYRFWTSLFVVLYLLTTSLPASDVLAADQAGSCAAQSLQSASLAESAVVPASADVVIEIPKETVDAAIFLANWRQKLNDAEELEEIVFHYFLITPGAELGDGILDKFRKEYETRLDILGAAGLPSPDEDLIVHTILNVAMEMPELASAVPAIWHDLSSYSQYDPSDVAAKISASTHRYDLGVQLRGLEPDVLKKVYDCAQKNPTVAEIFDKFYSAKLNAGIGDSAEELLAKNVDLSIPIEIRNGIDDDGTISLSLNDIKALSEAEFEKLHISIDEIQETLVEIDKQQDVIIDYIENQELKEKWQAIVKKKAAEQQLKLDALKSSISIITILSAQINPKFSKDFSVVANSSLQVDMALNDWLKAVSGLKGIDKIFSLSTVVMTGNVLSAVMNVVALLGGSQPSPEQKILEEIGKLRQQIDQLRTEMHSRFDRIDQELNAIYTSMNQRFNQIDIVLGKIDGNVLEIQQSLVMLDLKLSRIERNNFELLNAVARCPLLEAINGGLGYRRRTGSPMPESSFGTFENQFHSWATLHAFDSGDVGPAQRDYSDSGLLTELTTYPLDANLNYLNGWLVVHGLPAITEKPLPSPRDRLLASRAYTQLGLEEPEQMAKYVQNDPQRQKKLNQISIDLETVMQNISTILTPSGPQGNSLLFTSVVTLYQGKLNAIDLEIQALETAFNTGIRTSTLERNEPFDLYGDVTQTISFGRDSVPQDRFQSLLFA